jgi:hypothetical protein
VKEGQPVRVTRLLSSTERESDQESKREPASEGHSLSVERRARDWLEQRNMASLRGALTDCGAQSEELVRRAKESQPARHTHFLLSVERGTGQDNKRKPANEGHSPTVERTARDWLGQLKPANQRGALTNCRAQSEGLIRTAKEGQPARVTHFLSSAERGTCQDCEIEPASQLHSRPVERRARDWSRQRNKTS